jgi:hypothetical protein
MSLGDFWISGSFQVDIPDWDLKKKVWKVKVQKSELMSLIRNVPYH